MSANVNTPTPEEALKVIREQLAEAVAAGKCHGCGCLHQTVEALDKTGVGRAELASDLALARRVFLPKKYDCLGCEVCYPAIAANAFAEAFPGEGERLELCPTEPAPERRGWPPLPGDYYVVRYGAPVAACTLNSDALATHLVGLAPEGLAIVGFLHTENLGIERLIKNVLANPNIRVLLLAGEDTRQAIGHLPGQSLESLLAKGVDDSRRIRGARGRRPVLKNVSLDEIEAFRRQVTLVSFLGETDAERLAGEVCRAARSAPGPFQGAPESTSVATVEGLEPERLVSDPAGYCVVYPDRQRKKLLVEHYTNAGVLDCVVEAATPAAAYGTLVERGLVTRLDHAAYLGRELARAERSVATGEPYVQDRAAGEIEEKLGGCGCATPCAPEGGNR